MNKSLLNIISAEELEEDQVGEGFEGGVAQTLIITAFGQEAWEAMPDKTKKELVRVIALLLIAGEATLAGIMAILVAVFFPVETVIMDIGVTAFVVALGVVGLMGALLSLATAIYFAIADLTPGSPTKQPPPASTYFLQHTMKP